MAVFRALENHKSHRSNDKYTHVLDVTCWSAKMAAALCFAGLLFFLDRPFFFHWPLVVLCCAFLGRNCCDYGPCYAYDAGTVKLR